MGKISKTKVECPVCGENVFGDIYSHFMPYEVLIRVDFACGCTLYHGKEQNIDTDGNYEMVVLSTPMGLDYHGKAYLVDLNSIYRKSELV